MTRLTQHMAGWPASLAGRFMSTEIGAALLRNLGIAALAAALMVPILAFAAYSWAGAGDGTPVDFALFGPAGASILTGHWSQVFANPLVQAGPFEMVPYGVAELVGVSGRVGWIVFYVVFLYLVVWGFTLGTLAAVSTATSPQRRTRVYVALAIATVGGFGWFVPSAVFLGHPADVVIPMLWVIAASFARERQVVIASVIVTLSAGWEVWGVLGAAVLMLALKPHLVRAFVRALVAATVTLAIIYLPFIATGTFAMFSLHWDVAPNSLVHALLPGATAFPWSLRVLQAVLALIAGCAVALAARRSSYAIWLVPLAMISARLIFDPALTDYYWAGPAALAAGFAALALLQRAWVRATVAVGVLVWLLLPIEQNFVVAIVLLVLTIGAAAIAEGRKA